MRRRRRAACGRPQPALPAEPGDDEAGAGGRAAGHAAAYRGAFEQREFLAQLRPWRSDPAESPAGGMTGTGVHVIDSFTALVGPATRVSTLLVQRKPPPGALDSFSVMLEFACGISGTLSMVRATPRFWRLHLFGERGSVEAVNDTDVVLRESGRAPELITAPPVDTLRAELEAFAEAAGGGAPYPLPPDQAVANVAAFEAIVRSLAAGGAPTAVEGRRGLPHRTLPPIPAASPRPATHGRWHRSGWSPRRCG
ncbi:Gfo/Idh/MocA family oxidoreductase [Siccirubricoccus deserti]